MSGQQRTSPGEAKACPQCGRDDRIIGLWMQKAEIPLVVYAAAMTPLAVLIVADLLGLFLWRGSREWFVLGRLALMIYVLLKMPQIVRRFYQAGVTRTRLCRECGCAFAPTEPEAEKAGTSGTRIPWKWQRLLELVNEFNGSRRRSGT